MQEIKSGISIAVSELSDLRHERLNPALPQKVWWNIPQSEGAIAGDRFLKKTRIFKDVSEWTKEPFGAALFDTIEHVHETDDCTEDPFVSGWRLHGPLWIDLFPSDVSCF